MRRSPSKIRRRLQAIFALVCLGGVLGEPADLAMRVRVLDGHYVDSSAPDPSFLRGQVIAVSVVLFNAGALKAAYAYQRASHEERRAADREGRRPLAVLFTPAHDVQLPTGWAERLEVELVQILSGPDGTTAERPVVLPGLDLTRQARDDREVIRNQIGRGSLDLSAILSPEDTRQLETGDYIVRAFCDFAVDSDPAGTWGLIEVQSAKFKLRDAEPGESLEVDFSASGYYLSHGEPERALTLIEGVLSKSPSFNGYAGYRLASAIHEKLGAFGDAIAAYERWSEECGCMIHGDGRKLDRLRRKAGAIGRRSDRSR